MEYSLDGPVRSIRGLQGTLAIWLQERLQRMLQMPEGGSSVYSSLSVQWTVLLVKRLTENSSLLFEHSVSSTFPLLLTPLTIASYSPASHLGSVSMALSSTGSSHTYHLASSMSYVITLSRPSTPPPVASPWLRSRSCAFYHVHYPLRTLISSLSLNHHLYADDTQLLFSFYPANSDSSITHLQNALIKSLPG